MCFSNITITHSQCYMDHVNHFKDLFESLRDYRVIVLLVFLFKNDDDLLYECGFLKTEYKCLCLEFKKIFA